MELPNATATCRSRGEGGGALPADGNTGLHLFSANEKAWKVLTRWFPSYPPKTYKIPLRRAAACNDRADGGTPAPPSCDISTSDHPAAVENSDDEDAWLFWDG
jgi:hypothetical protein